MHWFLNLYSDEKRHLVRCTLENFNPSNLEWSAHNLPMKIYATSYGVKDSSLNVSYLENTALNLKMYSNARLFVYLSTIKLTVHPNLSLPLHTLRLDIQPRLCFSHDELRITRTPS